MPPAKRRRLDEQPPSEEPSAEDNASVQHFMGMRENRWLSGQTPPANEATPIPSAGNTGNTVQRAAPPPSSTNNTLTAKHGHDLSAARTDARLSLLALQQQRKQQSLPAATSPQVVQYDSPLAAAGIPSTFRRAVNANAPAASPSLPSPAPSDENPKSPVYPDGRRHLAHTWNNRTPSTAFAPAITPLWANPTQPVRSQTVQSPHLRTGFLGTQVGQLSDINGRGMGMASPSPPIPPVIPSNQLAAPQRSRMEELLWRIDDYEKRLGPRALGTTEVGRLTLLRDAVRRNDTFFQVLNQLFCLRTCNPNLLPQAFCNLDKGCYDHLDNLLCPNNAVHPSLVQFSSTFPENLMTIYSSNEPGPRIAFEATMSEIKFFMVQLPRYWHHLVNQSGRFLSPPLVQDLHDVLLLRSPVLQTTAFRAIARAFWLGEEGEGLNALERLHTIDQGSFYQYNFRRTEQERLLAYRGFRAVYERWKMHCDQQTTEPFVLPVEVANHFNSMPRSMLPAQTPLKPPAAATQHQLQFPQAQQAAFQQQRRQLAALSAGGEHPTAPPLHIQQYQPTQQSSVTPAQSGHPHGLMRSSIYPHLGVLPRAQPTHPDTDRSALHQAHLRSPTMGSAEVKPDDPKLYRHVIGYVLSPKELKSFPAMQTVVFNVTPQAFAKLPQVLPPDVPGEPVRYDIGVNSQLYRIRCALSPPHGFPLEDDWIAAENTWPTEILFKFNGRVLESRNKLQHGRYKPVDLTQDIVAGQNTLEVFISPRRGAAGTKKLTYGVAVEVFGFTSHDGIHAGLTTLSAADSLAAIKKSLASSADEDDDFAVMSSTLSINLFDPFSAAKICALPVRGAACLHRDCFDLETFLGQCVRPAPGRPTAIDVWRCPLCRGDVRPQNLVVDGFLVEVREELAKRGLLETKAVVVESDGTWKVKRGVERSGVRSASAEGEEGGVVVAGAGAAQPGKVIEFIEID